MTRRWSAGLVFGLAVAAAPALAQAPSPAQPEPATSTTASPPAAEASSAIPKVIEAPAAEPAPDRQARYQFVRVGDTILKLDGDSGEVGLCQARGGNWACQTLPQGGAEPDREIARLRDEVAVLKGELTAAQTRSQRQIDDLRSEMNAVRQAAAPPPPPPAPPPPERPAVELRMPSAQDYERARAVIEDAWRRLVAAVAQVQSDVMRKL